MSSFIVMLAILFIFVSKRRIWTGRTSWSSTLIWNLVPYRFGQSGQKWEHRLSL